MPAFLLARTLFGCSAVAAIKHAHRARGPEICGLANAELEDLGLTVGACSESFDDEDEEHNTRSCHQGGRTKPMLWVHVHKTAGTTMCYLSMRNCERVISPSNNCNWSPNDRDFGTIPVKCTARVAHFQSANATWGQIERNMYQDDYCFSDFDYGIMLRDPVKREISEAKHYRWPKSTLLDARHLKKTSNLVVRAVAGDFLHGEVTVAHAEKAIELLSQFKVVMILEEVETQPELFEAGLRWNESLTKTPHKNGRRLKFNLTHEETNIIRAANEYDAMVYEHFQKISLPERFKRYL